MRAILLIALVIILRIPAQCSATEFSVVFVRDQHARPMHGAYATPFAAQAWLSGPRAPAWTVEMHFTVSEGYPYSAHDIGRRMSWPLSPDAVRDGRHRHARFSIFDCWCKDPYLLVIHAGDTMRVDLPDDPSVRRNLQHLVAKRSGSLPSPELVRFRPGRFAFATLAEDADMHHAEQRIAHLLLREAAKRAPRSSNDRCRGEQAGLWQADRAARWRHRPGWVAATGIQEENGALALHGSGNVCGRVCVTSGTIAQATRLNHEEPRLSRRFLHRRHGHGADHLHERHHPWCEQHPGSG